MPNSKINSYADYVKFYESAKSNTTSFWLNKASSYSWYQAPTVALEGSFIDADIKWFRDGKLNITESCLDRHVKNHPHRTAFHWQPQDTKLAPLSYTYQELLAQVNKMANLLKENGIKKRDRVIISMGHTPEIMISILACARIGAIHCLTSPNLSEQDFEYRINDCQASCLIIHSELTQFNKIVNLKQKTDSLMKSCTSLSKRFIFDKNLNPNDLFAHDIIVDKKINQQFHIFQPQPMNAEDPLFILYNSENLGIVHSVAGYMIWAGETFKDVFQMKDIDLFWNSSDCYSISGHSYMCYGPLLNGLSQFICENTCAEEIKHLKLIQKFNITHFYTSVDSLKMIKENTQNSSFFKSNNQLKVLAHYGAPISEDLWDWIHAQIGNTNISIINTYLQASAGGITIASYGNSTVTRPGFCMYPYLGIKPIILNSNGYENLNKEAEGELCFTSAWPGIARNIWGNHKKYKDRFFSRFENKYTTHDSATMNGLGDYKVIGKKSKSASDNSKNFEIESILNKSKFIYDSVVIPLESRHKQMSLFAFLVLNQQQLGMKNFDFLKSQLNSNLSHHFKDHMRIQDFVITKDFPRTKSGKISRETLKMLVSGDLESIDSVTNIKNPRILETLKYYFEMNNKKAS